MKKLLSMLLAAAMLVSASAMAFAEGTSEKGTIVYGSSTELGGDFAPDSWWTNNATDKMVRNLTNDYTVITTNQGGEYVVNPTIANNIESVVNPDGSKTFTVTINEGLTYNNGEEIKAADFLWAEVFSCSKVAMDVGAKMTGYLTYVGGQEYYDGAATAVSGIRLIDDYTFSVTIVADKIPYYYDLRYIQLQPLSIKYWLGDGVELKDDGEGCYIAGDFSKDGVGAQLEYARFNAGEDRVSAGPYNLVAFDKGSLQATLTINPNYAGNFEGQKPSVEKIVVTKTEDATWADALKTGAFNFYDTVTDGDQINTALDIIAEGGFNYVQFDRAGYGMLNFQCDFGPTQFEAVRHAVALLLDRNEFANTFCQGWGGVVNGMYGTGLWQYQEAEEWLEMTLNPYSYDPEKAKELLKEAGYPDGFTTTLMYSNTTANQKKAEFYKQQLSEVGIDLELNGMENAVLNEKVQGADCAGADAEVDCYLSGWSTSTGDADWGLRPMLATESEPPMSFNISYYENEKVDQLLKDGLATADEDKRGEIYAEVQDTVWKDLPLL